MLARRVLFEHKLGSHATKLVQRLLNRCQAWAEHVGPGDFIETNQGYVAWNR
jgi:hypothetical protein